ncbi:MAG TPA: hypothetical protein VGV37_29660 [Aliidongia sp.]|uniref:hypothetical protein n=1 Tax=Aliidongia sp. TaxID=1914230 RepID=UPI002DDD5C25|nr:hypothetical protein [Aliidongia sp.]HEV2678731.1 hypothetical protein [Aliidongia sp.]
MRKTLLPVFALGALLLAGTASAQTPPAPTRTRATIESVSETSIAVKTRTGQAVTIALTPETHFVAVSHGEISAIQPNSYIGTAAAPQPDGSLKAIEVTVFPESMRGSGDGHYAWDLPNANTMTNGVVGKLDNAHGRTLTVDYKGGEKQIVVPDDVPVVTLAPGDRTLLKPGVHVVVIAAKAADGTLSANAVLAGQNGVVPPM